MDDRRENVGFGLKAEIRGRDRNDGIGSFVCIRTGSKLGRFSGGEPTFTLECRQCAGGQTYETRSLKVRVVPAADIHSTAFNLPTEC